MLQACKKLYEDISYLHNSFSFAHQVDSQIRSLLTDMDVKVTQGHTLLNRAVTELEQAVASNEAGVKSKIAGTEKRLALQEAAMKERVINLEVSKLTKCVLCYIIN